MKVAKTSASLFLLFLLLGFIEINFNSCQKEIVKDTVRIKDTIRITDTVHVVDSSTCNCYDLKDGLVAYYNFTGGNLNDSSGNNNNISFNNAVKTTDRKGVANNAYLFNGTSSYMQVPNSASLNPTNGITLMATFKINGFNSGNCLNNQVFGKGWNDYINGFYVMRFGSLAGCNASLDTTREAFSNSYGDLNARVGFGLSDNANYVHSNIWYTVVYTYGSGQSNIYVNGVLKGTMNQSPLNFTPNSQELYIGKHGDPQYPYNFNGVIDEIRIYNKALCAGAVKQLSTP